MATEGSFLYSIRYGYLYVGVTLRFLPKEGESLAAGEIKVGMTSEWPRAG
jgi:hypothetical protein